MKYVNIEPEAIKTMLPEKRDTVISAQDTIALALMSIAISQKRQADSMDRLEVNGPAFSQEQIALAVEYAKRSGVIG